MTGFLAATGGFQPVTMTVSVKIMVDAQQDALQTTFLLDVP